MNAPLYRKVEIAFWDFIIQVMSENERVRRGIQRIYRVLHDPQTRRTVGLLAASAAAGLVSGFIFFLLITF